MGTINIYVPGEMDLEFKVESMDVINRILGIIKGTEQKKADGNAGEDDIVGIWKDRFDENRSSEMIQREWREKTWKRF
jgi:hypothetical protein